MRILDQIEQTENYKVVVFLLLLCGMIFALLYDPPLWLTKAAIQKHPYNCQYIYSSQGTAYVCTEVISITPH